MISSMLLILISNIKQLLCHIVYSQMSHVMRKPVLPYVNNKSVGQPAHPRSLISTFVVHCLDSIIPLVSISKISSLQLISVAEQASLSLLWSQTTKTGFLVTRLKLFRDVICVISPKFLAAQLKHTHKHKYTLPGICKNHIALSNTKNK